MRLVLAFLFFIVAASHVPAQDAAAPNRVESLLARMTLEEKVGQLVMTGFDAAFAQMNKDSEPWDMAGMYAVQSIIEPHTTRDYLIRMLDVHRLRMSGGVGQHLMRSWPTSY